MRLVPKFIPIDFHGYRPDDARVQQARAGQTGLQTWLPYFGTKLPPIAGPVVTPVPPLRRRLSSLRLPSAIQLVTPIPLPPGLTPRKDVSKDVETYTLDNGNTRYRYGPDAGIQHGAVVDIEPGGVFHIKLVHAHPAHRARLGTGTDMLMALASRANSDGVNVRAIKAKWIDEPGVDAQHAQYTAAINAGMSETNAAMTTFSGKQARRYGFTRVAVETDADGDYVVQFTRP